MFPFDKDGKTRWPAKKAKIKFKQLRAEVIARLRARDAEHGIPPNGQVYATHLDDLGNAIYEIDPVLARAKHSGAETNYELQKAWDEFCAEPRDSSEVTVPRPKRVFKVQPEGAEPEPTEIPESAPRPASPRRNLKNPTGQPAVAVR